MSSSQSDTEEEFTPIQNSETNRALLLRRCFSTRSDIEFRSEPIKHIAIAVSEKGQDRFDVEGALEAVKFDAMLSVRWDDGKLLVPFTAHLAKLFSRAGIQVSSQERGV